MNIDGFIKVYKPDETPPLTSGTGLILGKLARHETPNFDRYPRTRSADFTQTKASTSPFVTHSRDPAKARSKDLILLSYKRLKSK